MKAFGILKYGHLTLLGIGLALGGLQVAPVHAQSATGGYSGNDASESAENGLKRRGLKNVYEIPSTRRITPPATKKITRALRDSYSYCSRMRKKEFRVDCLGEQLDVIAKSMPATGDYAEARVILQDASNKLRRVARANKAPNQPRVRATGKIRGKPVVSRPLTPVRRDKVDAVNKQAANILAEAETKLLRSAEASDRRLIAYAQMAKAVGSNKTLLRSA